MNDFRTAISAARRAATLLACLAGGGAVALAAPGVPSTRALANGLRVVVLEDHTSPLVAATLWIHAGSKDEIDTSAGYAHFLEHMVQRGAAGSGPFEYQRLAHRWGGSLSVRAHYDRTHLTLSGSASALGAMIEALTAMALHADLKNDQIDLELGTLSQEIRSYYDEPASVAFLETVRAVFPGHPYRYPPLGNFQTLGALKSEPLTAFYRNLYVPNGMVLVVAGDVDPAAVLRLAERGLGAAPRIATLAAKPPAPAAFPGHSDVEKRVAVKSPWVNLGFAGPAFRHPDRPAFEILARLLGEAGGSPILAALLRAEAGSAARVVSYRLEDASMLYIGMTPATPEMAYAAATAALREIVAFRKRGVPEPDLRAVVDRILREERLRAEPIAERAEALGEAELFGGTRYHWDLPVALARLTPADIARVASTWIVEDNLKLVAILPSGTPPLADEQKASFHETLDLLKRDGPAPAPDFFARTAYAGQDAGRPSPQAWGDPGAARGPAPVKREVLGNGCVVVAQEDGRHGLAAVSIHLKAGSEDDPPGKEGRAHVAAHALAAALRSRAGSDAAPIAVETIVGRDHAEIRFRVAPADLKPALRALSATLRSPASADATFARARDAALAMLEASGNEPSFVGLELFHEKVYAGHGYAHPSAGTTSGLRGLADDDVGAYLADALRPDRTVVAVAGAVDADRAVAAAVDLLKEWKGKEGGADGARSGTAPAGAPEREEPEGGLATRRARAGEFSRALATPQSHVIVGVPGAAVRSADFPDLRLIGTALTVQAFEDMVFKRRAAFSAAALPEGFRDGGALAIGVVAAHLRRDEAVFDVQRLMRRLANDGLPQEEIDALARLQTGRDAAAAQGVLAAASALGFAETGGAPTPRPVPSSDRLREVAARYLRPEAWIVVKVGPASP